MVSLIVPLKVILPDCSPIKKPGKTKQLAAQTGLVVFGKYSTQSFFFLPVAAGKAEENKDEPFPIVLLAEPAAWEEGKVISFSLQHLRAASCLSLKVYEDCDCD